MKGKSLSFATVLKNRSQSSLIKASTTHKLADLLLQFESHPHNDYTLYLSTGTSRKTQQDDYPSTADNSRNNIFDSWIQMQSTHSNKENYNKQSRKEQKEHFFGVPQKTVKGLKIKESTKMPTRMMAELKKKNSSSQLLNEKANFNVDNPKNQQKEIKATDREINKFGDTINQQSIIPLPKPCQSKSIKATKQNDHLRNQLQKITEKKVEQINLLFSKDNDNTDRANSRIQQLIANTENIHNEIANLARKYAYQRKHQQDELLLSNSRTGNEETQNKRWEQAKSLVNGFFDKINKNRQPEQSSLPIDLKQQFKSDLQQAGSKKSQENSQVYLHVGYSFAVNEGKTYQISQNQIMDRFSEIQSERTSQQISDSGQLDFAKNSQAFLKCSCEFSQEIHSQNGVKAE